MDSEGTIKRIVLKRMERCIVCHHTFEPTDITVISREKDLWTMLVECTDCLARNFVAAVLNDGDPEDAQLALRRLSEQVAASRTIERQSEPQLEQASQHDAGPVTAGDVVEMHEFLKTFDGDFTALFES